MPIVQRTGPAPAKTAPSQPCACGSGVFWLDPYRGFHCSACEPPPTPKMAKENLLLVPDGSGKFSLRSVSEILAERRRAESLAGIEEEFAEPGPIDSFGRPYSIDWEDWWQAGYAALLAMEKAPAVKTAPEPPGPAPAPEAAAQAVQRPRPKAPPARSRSGA